METPIRFTVSYGLREYLAILADFLPGALSERGRPCERLNFGSRLALAAVVTPMFGYKKLRIGDCSFVINAEGLTRDSRSGPLVVPWRKVLRVHRLKSAYLIQKDTGMMPLPYRCFTAAERQRLERWAGERLLQPAA